MCDKNAFLKIRRHKTQKRRYSDDDDDDEAQYPTERNDKNIKNVKIHHKESESYVITKHSLALLLYRVVETGGTFRFRNGRRFSLR